jgi:hypothetical protein
MKPKVNNFNAQERKRYLIITVWVSYYNGIGYLIITVLPLRAF